MKRITLFFIAAALLVTAAVSASTASADGRLDQVLNNMQKTAASITTIFANMEQVKRDRAIGGTEKYSGQVFFKHAGKGNDKVKIIYSVPRGQTVWVVGDEVTLYQASIKQAIKSSRRAAASKGDEFAFVATPYTSVPELKRQFNISYAGEEQGMAKLELTPKGKSSLRSLTLWVDQSSWLPMKYYIVEASGNASTFTLSGVKVNGVISNGTFDVKLPKDAKIIRK